MSVFRKRYEHNNNTSICPTEVTNQDETEKFYKVLEEVLNEEREYYNLIIGDWNAKVGSGGENKMIMGKQGLEKRNDN